MARLSAVTLFAVSGVAVAAPTAAIAAPAGLDPGLVADGDHMVSVIVTGSHEVVDVVHGASGRVTALLPIVDGVAAVVPAKYLDDVAASDHVRVVTANRMGSFADAAYESGDEPSSGDANEGTTPAEAPEQVAPTDPVASADPSPNEPSADTPVTTDPATASPDPVEEVPGVTDPTAETANTPPVAPEYSHVVFDAPENTGSNFVHTTGATTAWAQGNFGAGIGVAVLDTGISPMPDFAGRLVHGPDLSGEGTVVDNYGHGTVMAGLINGNGADSADRTEGAYTGVAPGAHVVAVKVAGRNGAADVSTILQGLHWVAAYRDQFNIRVLNLSWGVHSTQSTALDPLNFAVERLWDLGIVVVVAAGNSGPSPRTITKPGDDPVVLTVGAYNDRGDSSPGNDFVPKWSSRGPTLEGVAKPDLVAPGRSVVATRSYGSHIALNNPKSHIAPSYIKGSGTSQATAIASGVAALLIAARPDLTPDQVKDLLVDNVLRWNTGNPAAQGAGRLHLADALTATPLRPPQPRLATGLGSLEAARGGAHVVANCDGVDTVISGEVDARCEAWDPFAWTASEWTGDAWTGVSWKGAEWTGVSWKDAGWSEATWDGVSWKNGTWTADAWQSAAWTGTASQNSAWTGVSWKSVWSSNVWTAYQRPFLSAFWGNSPKAGQRVSGEQYIPLDPDEEPLIALVPAIHDDAPVVEGITEGLL